MTTQPFITQNELEQIYRFLENVTSANADNGKGSQTRGLPLGFSLTDTGVIVTRQGYDGRSYQSFTFKVVK